jgi:hypothetical protein
MTKKKPRYESRVFDGRIIHSAEIERIHKEVLDFKRIEAISEPMRELIEDLWPELANKSRQKPIDSRGTHHAPWFWALHFPSKPENLRTDNRVATLEAAKAEFEASWRQWMAWAKLGEAP